MVLINFIKYIFFFKIIIFIYLNKLTFLSECNFTYPIMRGNECISFGCSRYDFISEVCILENDIVKTQRLTSVINFSEENYEYIIINTTPNGNLIASSTIWGNTLKYYFGLKKNGRPYFYINNKESTNVTINSDKGRLEGNIFAININGTHDDKEYIISFGNSESNFELYDFESNNTQIYYQELDTFFQTSSIDSQKTSLFKLKNKENSYIICLMGQDQSSIDNNFYLIKLVFDSIEIAINNPIINI